MDEYWRDRVVIVSGSSQGIGKRIAGGPQTPERGEVVALRRELESSHQEADRLDTLELRVGRIQEQIHFLERLLESEPRGLSERSKVAPCGRPARRESS